MATERYSLPLSELDRIYERRIRPDILGDMSAAQTPTAVFVGGQPGAGKSYAAARVRAHLAANAGASAVIASDELREYHPHWRSRPQADPQAADLCQSDVGTWFSRLITDAIAQGSNMVIETTMRRPHAFVATSKQLRRAGYEVYAVVLATDRDQSRQVTVARHDVARTVGLGMPLVVARDHDAAYDELRISVAKLESEGLVDRLQLVVNDGRQLYANQMDAGAWRNEPKAVAVLDDFRERPLNGNELADRALRWSTLAQRTAATPQVPRALASQVLGWRNEAVGRAEPDPDAQQRLRRGYAAEAFTTMPRQQFLQEFPQYAKAIARLDEAIAYAEKTLAHAADRERFVMTSRERLADRIAEGKMAASERGMGKEGDERSR